MGRVSCCGKTNASGGGGRGFWWGSLVQLLQLEKESWAGVRGRGKVNPTPRVHSSGFCDDEVAASPMQKILILALEYVKLSSIVSWR